MSRLAKKPIVIPGKVEVSTTGGMLSVKGGKDTLSRAIHPAVDIQVTPEGIMVTAKNSSKLARALTGTFAAHTRSMIAGVTTPWKRVLVLEGVGYKVENKGKELNFIVGFSHPVQLAIPSGVTASVEKNVITIEGPDKDVIGQFAAHIRRVKPPEPYLGKGIRYQGEVIRRKQGKKSV